MTKYECDRCGARVMAAGDLEEIGIRTKKRQGEHGIYADLGKELCQNCQTALRDFLRPLPKLTKGSEA